MTLNEEVAKLKRQIEQLTNKIKDLSKNTEEKLNKPYSKVGINRLMSNKDLVFNGKTGIWQTYAIYKDDEEEE